MNLGALLQAQGRSEEAERRLRRALQLKPQLAEAWVNLGNLLQQCGELEEAVASHKRALRLRPDFAEAHFNLGNARQSQKNFDEAAVSYQRALTLQPARSEFHGNLGNALLAQKKLDEAVASYQRALALRPDFAEACYNMGNARKEQGNLDEAVACFERAIALKPELPEAYYNLGCTLHSQEKFHAAEARFEQALALRPDYAAAHYNLGCVLKDQGRLEEALAKMAQAVALDPDYAQALFAHALAQLQNGELDPGWRNYESRWQSCDHQTPMRPYSQPRWCGETLESGRILLWGEQGVGDEVLFARLIPDAMRVGNPITLDCDPRLQPLFARSFPGVEVIAAKTLADTELATFPVHLPTGSLPSLFRASEAAFAVTTSPYLKADPVARERFRTRYADGRQLVGLAWQTNNAKTGRKRSMDLERFAPLFAIEGIRWISLQYGDFDALEAQAARANAPILVDREVDQFADLDGFAAQVAAMDRVIAIDNSTVHLAGALGIPVSVLLPFAADWRWMERRTDCPWYPTMRLFRQSRLGDWETAVEDVVRQWRT